MNHLLIFIHKHVSHYLHVSVSLLTKKKLKNGPNNKHLNKDWSKRIVISCLSLIGLYLVFIASALSESVQEKTTMQVQVLSEQGIALEGIVVELVTNTTPSTSTSVDSEKDKTPAIMNQIDQQFQPHILVIEKGDLVSFPNSDDIKHHVYSFSPTKSFEQQLYKGREAAPVLFEDTGVVELGCNIHDWMLGYIYVADSKHYAISNEDGIASFSGIDSATQVYAWHPLMNKPETRESKVPLASELNAKKITIKLAEALLESHGDYERISIDAY